MIYSPNSFKSKEKLLLLMQLVDAIKNVTYMNIYKYNNYRRGKTTYSNIIEIFIKM